MNGETPQTDAAPRIEVTRPDQSPSPQERYRALITVHLANIDLFCYLIPGQALVTQLHDLLRGGRVRREHRVAW